MKWIREHALALLVAAMAALGTAIAATAFLYHVVAYKLPAIEVQLTGIRQDLRDEMVRTQGVQVDRLAKVEGAIAALRVSLLDLRIKLKKPPTPKELKELISTVDDFVKAQSENFLEATIAANANDLPLSPRWTSNAYDIRTLRTYPTARDKADIGKLLGLSLVTPDTRWEVSGEKLKATYAKGHMLFVPSNRVDAASLKKLAAQFNALGDTLEDVSHAIPDKRKETK